jgi:hypothetical protein
MPWKIVRLAILLTFVMSLTACHAVDENQSQVSLAKPAEDFLAQAQAKVHEVVPSFQLPQAHSLSGNIYHPMPKYWLQANNPAYLSNFAHPDAACNWMGVTGQVFDSNGTPIEGIKVEVKGTLNGVAVDNTALTGASKIYGPGAFEIILGTQGVDSQGSLVAQLIDAKGTVISTAVPINTYKDCQKNLILVNYIQVDNPHAYLLPLITSNGVLSAR